MYSAVSSLDSEVYSLEYFIQEDVCRLCWTLGAKREINDETDEKFSGNTSCNLQDKIRECLNIDIMPKSVPNKLCKTCYQNIENFYNFKSFCRESDTRLSQIFKDNDFKHVIPTDLVACPIKVENTDKNSTVLSKPETIDDFLDSLRPSECSSDDEKPLKAIKRQKNTPTKTRIKDKNCYCNICKTEFENTTMFSNHNAEAHGIENGYFKCFGCEKRCKTRRGRVGHETQFCKNLKEGYKCPECAVLLPTRGGYEKHMKSHRENTSETLPEVSVKCRKCPSKFSTREGLAKHNKLEHDDVRKKFVCEQCGRVFTRVDYLHKHRLTHTGTKQHVCTHCGFRTTQRTSLTVHIRKHTGERPYSCDLCPQRCVSSSNLQAHRRRHLGDKKFQCSLCSKKFGYKVSLTEHVASAHAQGSAHSCALCGAQYARARGLKRHARTKHGDDGKGSQDDGKGAQDDGKVSAGGAELQEGGVVRIAETTPGDLAAALKGEEVYVKLQNDTYVKVLQVKETKSLISFELKGFDGKMSCLGQNGEVYDVKLG